MAKPLFAKGSRVEVRRPPSFLSPPGFPPRDGTFYPATVIRAPARSKKEVLVQYHTVLSPSTQKHPQEYVDLRLVRPVPPGESMGSFVVGDSVEAFYQHAWHHGVVMSTCDGVSTCTVFLQERLEELEFSKFNLRIRKDWVDQRWVPPRSGDELARNMKSDMEPSPKKRKLNHELVPPAFELGQTVEVTSNLAGFEGSWYSALIFDSLGNGNYTVEYHNFLEEDEAEPLHEEASASCIRPIPPPLPEPHFKLLDQVDCWYNDGWWEGVISKVMEGEEYVVYFCKSMEELVFPKSKLRPHQDWVDGMWIIASISKDGKNDNLK